LQDLTCLLRIYSTVDKPFNLFLEIHTGVFSYLLGAISEITASTYSNTRYLITGLLFHIYNRRGYGEGYQPALTPKSAVVNNISSL